eukprot:9469478-Pyramimonas_sp.AAC.1
MTVTCPLCTPSTTHLASVKVTSEQRHRGMRRGFKGIQTSRIPFGHFAIRTSRDVQKAVRRRRLLGEDSAYSRQLSPLTTGRDKGRSANTEIANNNTYSEGALSSRPPVVRSKALTN